MHRRPTPHSLGSAKHDSNMQSPRERTQTTRKQNRMQRTEFGKKKMICRKYCREQVTEEENTQVSGTKRQTLPFSKIV
jgi:hypothetical protein